LTLEKLTGASITWRFIDSTQRPQASTRIPAVRAFFVETFSLPHNSQDAIETPSR
jgi:hypothetical protein